MATQPGGLPVVPEFRRGDRVVLGSLVWTRIQEHEAASCAGHVPLRFAGHLIWIPDRFWPANFLARWGVVTAVTANQVSRAFVTVRHDVGGVEVAWPAVVLDHWGEGAENEDDEVLRVQALDALRERRDRRVRG